MEANSHGCWRLVTEDWGKFAHIGVCRTSAKFERLNIFGVSLMGSREQDIEK